MIAGKQLWGGRQNQTERRHELRSRQPEIVVRILGDLHFRDRFSANDDVHARIRTLHHSLFLDALKFVLFGLAWCFFAPVSSAEAMLIIFRRKCFNVVAVNDKNKWSMKYYIQSIGGHKLLTIQLHAP